MRLTEGDWNLLQQDTAVALWRVIGEIRHLWMEGLLSQDNYWFVLYAWYKNFHSCYLPEEYLYEVSRPYEDAHGNLVNPYVKKYKFRNKI